MRLQLIDHIDFILRIFFFFNITEQIKPLNCSASDLVFVGLLIFKDFMTEPTWLHPQR